MLGPDNVPAVTDQETASSDATFAVFSAITHSRSPEIDAILEVLAGALKTLDTDTALFLAEITEAGLANTAGQQKWRELMTTYLPPFGLWLDRSLTAAQVSELFA